MSPLDAAWLAGLLEGEGHFGWSTSNRKNAAGIAVTHRYPKVQLQMTDEDVIRRAAVLMETKVYGPYEYPDKRGGVRKPFWAATTTKTPQALRVMRAVLEHMGARRRARILEICQAVGS